MPGPVAPMPPGSQLDLLDSVRELPHGTIGPGGGPVSPKLSRVLLGLFLASAALAAPIFCTNCGTRWDQPVKFCGTCGAALGSPVDGAEAATSGTDPIAVAPEDGVLRKLLLDLKYARNHGLDYTHPRMGIPIVTFPTVLKEFEVIDKWRESSSEQNPKFLYAVRANAVIDVMGLKWMRLGIRLQTAPTVKVLWMNEVPPGREFRPAHGGEKLPVEASWFDETIPIKASGEARATTPPRTDLAPGAPAERPSGYRFWPPSKRRAWDREHGG